MLKNSYWFVPLVALAGCGGNQPGANNLGGTNMTGQPMAVAASGSAAAKFAKGTPALLVNAANDLGFKLLSKASKGGETNALVSPIAAASTLSLLANDSKGKANTGMLMVIGLDKSRMTEVNQANKALNDAFKDDRKSIAVAQSLWSKEELGQDLLKLNRQYFGGHTATIATDKAEAATAINKWAADKSGGRLKSAAVKDELDVALMSLSLMSFDGALTNAQKRSADFTPEKGEAKKLDMALVTGRIGHLKSDDFDAVRVPLGEGKKSLYVFLPNQDQPLAELLKKFNGASWSKWSLAFADESGALELPILKTDGELNLGEALGLGEKKEGEVAKPTSLLKQRTSLTLTMPEVENTSEAVEAMFKMDAHRPFLYLIVDSETGAIILAGTFVG